MTRSHATARSDSTALSRKVSVRWLATLLALVMVTAACSSSTDSVDVTADESAVSSEPEQSGAEDAAADDSSDDEPAESDAAEPASGDDSSDGAADDAADDDAEGDESGEPETLETFFGFDALDDPDNLAEREREVERIVATCMAEQGFQYTQRDVSSGGISFALGSSAGEDLSEEEYAAQYGYGIFTTFDEVFEYDGDDPDAFADPNDDLLSAMSEAERNAWTTALYGTQPEFDPETGQPIDPETGEPTDDFSIFLDSGGCVNEASEAVFGSFEILFQLESEFDELDQRISADPRIVELTSKWSACMAEAGYFYSDPEEPIEEISQEFNQFQFAAFNDAGVFDDSAPAIESDDGSGVAFEGAFGQPELSPEREAELQRQQAREIELAVADHACSDGLEEEAAAISAEYEARFIEENRSVLESARAGE